VKRKTMVERFFETRCSCLWNSWSQYLFFWIASFLQCRNWCVYTSYKI